MRVKCLAQEHNTMSPARARTRTARSGDERTNHEAFLNSLITACYLGSSGLKKVVGIMNSVGLLMQRYAFVSKTTKFKVFSVLFRSRCLTNKHYEPGGSKGSGKRGHIVADTNVSPFARARNICCGTNLVSGTQKMFLILFRNILRPQQMFPSLRSPRNIMSNNVSATMCPRLPVP